MGQTPKNPEMSQEEYLEFERASEIRHEYFDGEIFAMTDSSIDHNRIVSNINRSLGNQLTDRSCDVFSNNMRVKVQRINKYTYSDIVVACGSLELEDQKFDTLLNPIVIIEVFSHSTELYDRGKKFAHFRLIPSLREYVLVSQYDCQVEKFARGDGGIWRLFDPCTSMEEIVRLESIDCELLLSDIYCRVEFEKTDGLGFKVGQSLKCFQSEARRR